MSIKNFLLDLVFPRECISCNMDNSYLCSDCAHKIPGIAQSCPVCGGESANGTLCSSKCASQTHIDQLLSASSYKNSIISQSIHTFKYRFSHDLVDSLNIPMTATFSRHLYYQSTVIIPVPLHPRRLRFRGFNQAELLAQELARKVQRPYSKLLQRIRHTKPQQSLTQKQRMKNLTGAFMMYKSGFVPQHVTLIDDVYTTGSTANECAKILKQSGVQRVTTLVLTSTDRSAKSRAGA